MPNHLIYPMFVMVVLTFVVGLITFASRILAVRRKQVDPAYFKTFDRGTPPDIITKTTRHYANLFELPVLFYAGCLTALIIESTAMSILYLAWLFVGARIAHAYIHLTRNKLIPRMTSFMVGWVAVIGIWIQIALSVP